MVRKTLQEYMALVGITMVYDEITQFCNTKTLGKLNEYQDQEALYTYTQTKEFNNLILKEKLFQLGELIFGTDIVRWNRYYCLKRLMHDYKVNPNPGICKWVAWMSQLNNFISFMPDKDLDKKDIERTIFTEMDIQEVHNGALPLIYQEN